MLWHTQRGEVCGITDGGSMSGQPASGMCRNIFIVLQVGIVVGAFKKASWWERRHYVSGGNEAGHRWVEILIFQIGNLGGNADSKILLLAGG